ncbi:MAG: hypothetical protein AAB337_00480, partial [Patescibacteria group bacterium]
ALLAAYLLEKFVQKGKLNCKVSVDRCEIAEKGVHASARITENKTGRVMIIDSALGFIGHPNEKDAPWDYRRPEDKTPITNHQNGGNVDTETKNDTPIWHAVTVVLSGLAILLAILALGLNLKNNFDQVAIIEESFLHGPKQIEAAEAATDRALKVASSYDERLVAIEKKITVLEARPQVSVETAQLDADGDGVNVPIDVCPNSRPAEGEATYVIPTNGCLENEVVNYGGCTSTAFPPDKETAGQDKLRFLGCKLAEKPEYVYQCAYELNSDGSYKYIGDCHGFDPNAGP